LLGTEEQLEVHLDLKNQNGDDTGILTKSYEKLSSPSSSAK